MFRYDASKMAEKLTKLHNVETIIIFVIAVGHYCLTNSAKII